jgi:F0F1-type ATP synthase membrane subunit c/vacuolar-type H+-ATPase subunit K
MSGFACFLAGLLTGVAVFALAFVCAMSGGAERQVVARMGQETRR